MRERIDVELSKRFQEEILLPEAIRDYDMNFKELILLNQAYALMLHRIGLLKAEDCRTITKALSAIYGTMKREDIKANCEDLYFNVEQALIQKVGISIGGRLHTGRSRNDIYSALSRMEIRKTAWQVAERVIELQEVLLQEAGENIRTILTGYTHMQPGQPITLAHYYTSACYALGRDFSRIKNSYRNANRSPYGAAAFAGAAFPIDREYLCQLMGFDEVIENSIDSIASKDYLVEMEMAYSILMTNISRFASDMYFWATDECGILDLGGQVAICSSIMPQKKNPVCFEYAKSKGAHTIGGMISALTVLKNVPYTNNTDIFETSTMYEESLTQTVQGLDIFIEAVKYSKIKKEKAADMAAQNYSTVTGLADHLVDHFGLSFEEAHAVIGDMVGEIARQGKTIEAMTGAFLEKTAAKFGHKIKMTNAQVKEILDPWNNIESKKTEGSPNQMQVKKMIGELRQLVQEEKDWLKAEKENVSSAYQQLSRELEAL